MLTPETELICDLCTGGAGTERSRTRSLRMPEPRAPEPNSDLQQAARAALRDHGLDPREAAPQLDLLEDEDFEREEHKRSN